MEKRKVYKISIIDKEISRTEFDRNTFYTSDSELTLVFKLIERDYSYDHGEILLYNENDKSFVTRKITKQENDFVYEIDSDIIPHYGTWKAQLQLVKDDDVYTSKPFEFNIENDLSNLAPQPTLTDINNWLTLKQNANELIDEMQGLIVSVEQAELERVNKENARQQAESERVNKENYRKLAESDRLNKENQRQKAESERQTTFETNESGRKSAEQERQSAELIRVENENQREIDHENRSAELAGKANKTQEEWVTPTLLNGWKSVSGHTLQYMKDEFGFVHFRGRVTGGLENTNICNMPEGYRSTQPITLPICLSTGGISRVYITGSIGPYLYSSVGWSSLDSINYKAEV